ncbi:hypothetical protein B0187_04760 [Haemophilus paracuniculus]|uniref:Uncharacterized protein n=1 Tax=Haemophilus paracuniculus TaxID=734 RepID=A0A1T0AT24_9PAST|nr:hypothetical protein [Haemophilus paracuniculus]OOR99407.1 hypothetical protein B0187_04760 [Haemophilus paracuniculus]
MKVSAQIQKNITQFNNDLQKAQYSATRAGLRQGINEYKRITKPLIPKLAQSTPYRQKGALARKLRASVKLNKDKTGGRASLYFSTRADKPAMLTRKRVRTTKSGKKLTGAVKAYKNDAFYWFMVDQGTSKMTGRFYRNRAKAAGQARADQKLLETYRDTLMAKMKRWK